MFVLIQVNVSNIFKKMDNDQLFHAIIEEDDGHVSDDTQNDEDYTPSPTSAKRKRNQIRPKVSDSWSDDNIIKLIAEVEIRPCIWNVGTDDYKNRNKRDSAWQSIATVFSDEIPVDQLTAKWQNLRTQYRTSLASAKKTKSGQGVAFKPHWKFHSQMSFIGATEQSQTVRSESNFSLEDTDIGEFESQASGSSGEAVRNRKIVSTSNNMANTNETDQMLLSGMKCALDRLQQPKKAPDDAQNFGNYFVTELRKIKSAAYRETTQRKLLQLLWDSIDKEPVKFQQQN